MTAIKMLQQLFEHMEWADALVWRSVLLNSVAMSDSSVRERLLHIHVVQHGFLHLWRQQALPELPKPSHFPDTKRIASWGREYHENVAAYVAGLEETLLDSPLSIPWADQLAVRLGRPPSPVTLAQTMLQVTSHSSHHRGQVNVRLRELGCEPPLIDFITWLWRGKPSADWDSLSAGASNP
jgi:uncharacterized damage-inducible protein DinB